MARQREEGLEMFRRYIASHVFIHDDHWVGTEGDFDELSGHPLLLDAPLVVTSRTGGPIAMARETVALKGTSPLADLAASPATMEHVARTIADQRLDISAFYSDRTELSVLTERAADFGYRPRVHPSPQLFHKHSNHVANLDLLRGFEDFPQSFVAASFDQLRALWDEVDDGEGVYLKRTDSRSTLAMDIDSALKNATTEGLPILLQSARRNRGTAVFQWIQDGARARPLFVTLQIESESHHIGNVYSRAFEDEFFDRFEGTIKRWLSLVPRWSGPIAVDAILPIDGSSPIAVDLNARFNSSTIPIGQGLIRGSSVDWEYRRWDSLPPSVVAEGAIEFGQSLAETDPVAFSLAELHGLSAFEAL